MNIQRRESCFPCRRTVEEQQLQRYTDGIRCKHENKGKGYISSGFGDQDGGWSRSLAHYVIIWFIYVFMEHKSQGDSGMENVTSLYLAHTNYAFTPDGVWRLWLMMRFISLLDHWPNS